MARKPLNMDEGSDDARWRPPAPPLALPPQLARWAVLIAAAPILLAAWGFYYWFVQRVEVGPNEVLVLVRKMGRELPTASPDGAPLPPAARDQMVLHPKLLEALGEPPNSSRYKGVVYDVLPEGRYFYDPFVWKRIRRRAEFVEPNACGVLVRLYGRELPPGKIVATEPDERGPLAEVLMPGRYNVNPYAYEVKRVAPVTVPPGFVGVQRCLHGRTPANPNDWVVGPPIRENGVEIRERGVQPDVLGAGLYYINPYVRQVDLIDIRSHTLDLRGTDAIRFPSSDSFDVIIEVTVEYAINQDKAPYVMVAIGDHSDIEEKLILPFARSLSRIEGSKLLARDFITGESRQRFQTEFFDGLRAACAVQGIEIRATPIRRIEPPAAIANPISDRQLAEQQVQQFRNEIKVAEAQARLVEQEEMRRQNEAIGEINREVVGVVVQAEQDRAVALTDAAQRLEVARLALDAAREQAAALLSRGEAEAEVARLTYEAEAIPLRERVAAFGGGERYAQQLFYQRLGPALKSVVASTDGAFAEIFRSLSSAQGRPPRAVEPDQGSARVEPSKGGAE